MPPALFQTAAHGLERLSVYIGGNLGQAWRADTTWKRRKHELNELKPELAAFAKQHAYANLR